MSSWQLMFLQSKVNDARYDGDRLVTQNWHWPKETWFQMRLRDLRKTYARTPKNLSQPRFAAYSSLASLPLHGIQCGLILAQCVFWLSQLIPRSILNSKIRSLKINTHRFKTVQSLPVREIPANFSAISEKAAFCRR